MWVNLVETAVENVIRRNRKKPTGGGAIGGNIAKSLLEVLPDDMVDLAAQIANQIFFAGGGENGGGDASTAAAAAQGTSSAEITQIVRHEVTQVNGSDEASAPKRRKLDLSFEVGNF